MRILILGGYNWWQTTISYLSLCSVYFSKYQRNLIIFQFRRNSAPQSEKKQFYVKAQTCALCFILNGLLGWMKGLDNIWIIYFHSWIEKVCANLKLGLYIYLVQNAKLTKLYFLFETQSIFAALDFHLVMRLLYFEQFELIETIFQLKNLLIWFSGPFPTVFIESHYRD